MTKYLSRKEKIQLLENLSKGKTTVDEIAAEILPEKIMVIYFDDSDVVEYNDAEYTESEIKEIIKKEKLTHNVTVVRVKYGKHFK